MVHDQLVKEEAYLTPTHAALRGGTSDVPPTDRVSDLQADTANRPPSQAPIRHHIPHMGWVAAAWLSEGLGVDIEPGDGVECGGYWDNGTPIAVFHRRWFRESAWPADAAAGDAPSSYAFSAVDLSILVDVVRFLDCWTR